MECSPCGFEERRMLCLNVLFGSIYRQIIAVTSIIGLGVFSLGLIITLLKDDVMTFYRHLVPEEPRHADSNYTVGIERTDRDQL